MSDLRLNWNRVESADLGILANDIETDGGLETAVILSLFTDRRAEDSDALPDGHTDRRGWWGDEFSFIERDRIGSRLWLLAREKQLASVLPRAQAYALEALQWLVDDKVAESVTVVASFGPRPGWLLLTVTIVRPLTDPAQFRFDAAWTAQAARTEAA